MGDDHLTSLQPGTVIAGRYEVVKCLGAGSMGLVYACRHRELAGHLVAIKVLFPEVAQDKVAAARFRNEIFASYGVSHPNVVRAYEYLRDGELTAYTMEYVGGGDLADRLGKPGKLMAIDDIVDLLTQMCAGVQAIHDAGIVHRDLKPENILLTTDGQVKIADFGIARTGHGPKLTEHGGVVGTIDYVSPEYMLNSQVDWRSDIYALGILAYEMVTGESPFRGDSVYATMTKRLKEDPAPPSTLRLECPDELDRIILKAMVRDPEQRYQSAAEIYYDLNVLRPDSSSDSIRSEMTITNSQATQYVGPSVGPSGELRQPGAHEQAAAPRQSETRPSGRSPGGGSFNRPSPPRPEVVRTSVLKSSPAVEEATLERPPPDTHTSRRAASYEGTQVINPELFELASAFDEIAEHEPIKMDRILSRRSGASGEWEQRDLGRDPQVVKGGIDESRLRTLSQSVDHGARPLWLDIALVAFMVVVGIGVGFAILSVTFPQTFKPLGAEVSQEREPGGL